LDIVTRFIQSKEAPGIGLLTDILAGQTYMGEDLNLEGGTILSQMYQRMTPLTIQDIIDAVDQEGPIGGVLGSASFFGVGITSYKLTPQELYNQTRDAAYTDIELKVWSQVPREYRQIAEEYNKLEKEDKYKAKRLLMQHPAVVRILNEIEQKKQRWLLQNRGLKA
jgi:hypothetical protein